MVKNKNTKPRLLTNKDFEDVFGGFNSDAERIKYVSKAYEKMSITEAFNKFYGLELDNSVEKESTVSQIEIGGFYWGTVSKIDKSGVTFNVTGIKEEIVSKENFSDCIDAVKNYLLNHDNKLYFGVREKKHGVYYVSVLEGYYELWKNSVDKAIKHFEPMDVHIDSLTKGGYICHTTIDTISEVTGKNYTSMVFIPGSNIVLNIEHDFERWIGQDVKIIPQKITKYQNGNGPAENSILGSRKSLLFMEGTKNLYDIYNRDKLLSMNGGTVKDVFRGTVTGIINSNNKTGFFVELNDMYITGLTPVDASDLVDYRPGDQVNVYVKQFEVQDGKEPFVLNKKNQVVKCNTRCIFGIAK